MEAEIIGLGWMLFGLFIGAPLGAMILAWVSIRRHRDTQAVADAAIACLMNPTPSRVCALRTAATRLMAE